MTVFVRFVIPVLLSGFLTATASGSEFGLAENVLNDYKAIRYENVYTRVPTTGKLVSIKIADSGRVYYICREKSGIVIYHLEYRPMEGFKDKIEQELKDKTRKWDRMNPDELLLTKEASEQEVRKKLQKYSEAVWVRNEVVIGDPQQRPERTENPQRNDR